MKAIILLGMTGNMLILVTVARSPAMRTTSNIYICNMAVSGEEPPFMHKHQMSFCGNGYSHYILVLESPCLLVGS